MDKAQQTVGKKVRAWTRYDDDIGAMRSGTVVTNEVGRAIGRLTDDTRIVAEIDAELAARGYSDEEVHGQYERHYETQERAAIAAADTAIWDTSFTVEALPDEPVIQPSPPKPTRQPRGRRDRLAWVPVMQALAERYAGRTSSDWPIVSLTGSKRPMSTAWRS